MTVKIHRELLRDWDILIVDDDPSSLDIALLLLRHYGATIHTAVNGAQGLEKLSSLTPKLILSDLSMPVMDGWEMITRIRQDARTANIPIIALTAHAMVGDEQRAMAAGSTGYLSKPIDPTTFISDIVRCLQGVVEFTSPDYSASGEKR